MELKDRLKKARKNAKLTQAETVSQIDGLTQPAYSQLETGESKSSGKLVELATLFKVNPKWLATGEGEMTASARQIDGQSPEPIDLPSSSPSLIVLMDNLKDMEAKGELTPTVVSAINSVIEAIKSTSKTSDTPKPLSTQTPINLDQLRKEASGQNEQRDTSTP